MLICFFIKMHHSLSYSSAQPSLYKGPLVKKKEAQKRYIAFCHGDSISYE